MIGLIQDIIATILWFVLFFGIGFIANMLLKTTWFPVVLYLIIVAVYVFYWGRGEEPILQSLAGYKLPDYLLAAGGLIGAILSGSSIKALRVRGYKMF